MEVADRQSEMDLGAQRTGIQVVLDERRRAGKSNALCGHSSSLAHPTASSSVQLQSYLPSSSSSTFQIWRELRSVTSPRRGRSFGGL